MKRTISEEIQEFKRLIGEATSTANSGAYEQPLGFNQSQPITTCPQTGQPLVGSEMGTNAPTVDMVDISTPSLGSPTGIPTPTGQPGFDDMPYLSSHPSEWSFEGDEDEFLTTQGWERPTGPDNIEISSDGGEEDAMSVAFDEMDDDEDVFDTLQMFTETKNGLGWK